MWIKVDPTHLGEQSWVNTEYIVRCDVNTDPEPPWATLTMFDGTEAYVGDVQGMKNLQRAIGVELPRA